jgi:hypothetical protein
MYSYNSIEIWGIFPSIRPSYLIYLIGFVDDATFQTRREGETKEIELSEIDSL